MGGSSNLGAKTQIMQVWLIHSTSSNIVETNYHIYHPSFFRIFRLDVGAHHVHLCMHRKAIIAFLGDIWPQTPVKGPIAKIVSDADTATATSRFTSIIC